MKKNWVLLFIILMAVLLRFWDFGNVPPSPDWDEAALGYNAYSILKTGKDEFGQSFPIILRSFDDYKPSLYVYLAIPSVAVFGLNTVAVRIPSAVFGILTVLAVYFLTKEIFSLGNKQDKAFIEKISLLTSFFLAISSWHIQFSRIAFEANVSLAFTVFGLFFFLKGLKKNRFFIPSFTFFSFTFYTYQSAKVFTPLAVLLLIFIFRDYLWKIKGKFSLYFLVFAVLSLPFFWTTFTTSDAFIRARGVSVFSDITPFLEKSAQRLIRDQETGNGIGLIFDNRRTTYIFAFLNGYLAHFDLKWLFLTGDLARHQPPNFGHLYLFELPFFLIGIYTLVFGSFSKKTKLLIFLWVLLVPIPASITKDVPHAIRTLNFLPFFKIFISLGVLTLVNPIRKWQVNRLIKTSAVTAISLFCLFNFVYYLDQYFVQYNYFSAFAWQYGYKQAVQEVAEIKNNYKEIIVSNKAPLDQSYMFFLFFTKYDPEKYLQEGGTSSGGFAETNSFSKYVFRPIDWEHEEKEKKLFVGRPDDFPRDANIIETIYYPNGEPVIKIVSG